MSDINDLPWTVSPIPAAAKPKKRRRSKQPGRKRQAPRPDNPMRPETVTLQFSHNINGHPYGPGVVTVPHDVAGELLSREGQVRVREGIFQNPPAFIIGGRDARGVRLHEVPHEMFDTHYAAANPSDRMSGQGMVDPGLAAGNVPF